MCVFLMQISSLAKSIRVLADMEEPIGRILKKTEVCGFVLLRMRLCFML